MSHTVVANGFTISHKGTPGYEKNTTPDVCLTPSGPVPVPYGIISYSRDLIRGSRTVFADGGNSIAVKGSAHTPGYGDMPGSQKGVASGTNMHESTWITYSPNVYVEGKNICRLSDKLFMNNKNCIAASGHYEPPAGLSDVMKELCKIFCQTRDEWHNCKRGGGKCPKPSEIAKQRTNAALSKGDSALSRAIGKRYPGAIGRAEKAFYATADKIFEGARKIYDRAGLERAIKRQLDKLIKRKIVQKAAKMAGKAWLKLVPGLNVISTIVDVADAAYTGYEIYDMIKQSDVIMDKAIKVVPDVAIEGADGELLDIYDYKFDDPDTGYQDDWQAKQKQEEAYKKASGQSPKKVDNATCACDKKGRVVPSA
ncbi:DUF4150 domain-containing protein [Mesorhizobium sp. YR577]|uniref:DUF4150 domain-containing protein n=1 Tax=Mesorhizobium sp. YR577 TaxID=1884373 RepID=UPI0008ED7D5C|nr:DUF4150 domain-containing protein [Mesorhizobium sp. YR577]SFU10985.1 protein of unknown function [Mesorhizobium sp. YR577]